MKLSNRQRFNQIYLGALLKQLNGEFLWRWFAWHQNRLVLIALQSGNTGTYKRMSTIFNEHINLCGLILVQQQFDACIWLGRIFNAIIIVNICKNRTIQIEYTLVSIFIGAIVGHVCFIITIERFLFCMRNSKKIINIFFNLDRAADRKLPQEIEIAWQFLVRVIFYYTVLHTWKRQWIGSAPKHMSRTFLFGITVTSAAFGRIFIGGDTSSECDALTEWNEKSATKIIIINKICNVSCHRQLIKFIWDSENEKPIETHLPKSANRCRRHPKLW